MAIPIQQTGKTHTDFDDYNFVKAIDTRVAGGRKMILSNSSKVRKLSLRN